MKKGAAMATSHATRSDTDHQLNQLRRGETYHATTGHDDFVGEYLGVEVAHGDWAILIRLPSGTEAISLDSLTSIREAA